MGVCIVEILESVGGFVFKVELRSHLSETRSRDEISNLECLAEIQARHNLPVFSLKPRAPSLT